MRRGTAGIGSAVGHRFRVATVAALCSVLTFFSLASAALADNFKGTTTQDEIFKLRTDAEGVPTRASYGWDQDCTGGGSLTNGGTVSRFQGTSPDEFSGSGKYEADIEEKYEGLFRVRISGERVSDTRFKGSFKVKGKIFEKSSGDLLTKCSTGVVRWTADLQGEPTAPLGRSLPAGDLHRR